MRRASGHRATTRNASRVIARVALASGVATGPLAADEAVLIGGGYAVHRSEAQIELNVGWTREVLENAGLPVTTYFTDGGAPGADVFALPPADAPPGPLDALARSFGDRHGAALTFRESALERIEGSTRRDELMAALGDELAGERPMLFVYNGHGSQSGSSSPADVTLNLWDETELAATELHELLAGREAPFRFVFTQCYSGGFHRLAFADPDQGLALAEGQRCGFSAESAYRLAEGCSASIDIGDYRDYTSYFFAALNGRERDGEIVDRDPDLDGDGTTTLREAHFYTLEHAYSSDLSRSTSEAWLEAWQPWYLRWLPLPSRLPSNEYARLYRDLSARLDVTLDDDTPARLRDAIAALRGELEAIRAERSALREREADLQAAIAREILPRWPALLGPYAAGYRDLASGGGLDDAAAAIEALPAYAMLRDLQDADDALDARMVEAERAEVQRLKLLRFRRLANLSAQLQAHGSDAERADYASLIDCESVPLSGEPG